MSNFSIFYYVQNYNLNNGYLSDAYSIFLGYTYYSS